MPDFSCEDISIDPSEFIRACSNREIKELIVELIDEGHLPKSVLGKINFTYNSVRKYSMFENDFIEKMEGISEKYHSISNEDEAILEGIFKKYL